MNRFRTTRLHQLTAMLLLAALCGCGGDDKDPGSPQPATCVNMGNATYVGTEDVVVDSGPCPEYTDLAVTFTIVQAAGSCDFTLQSSLVSGHTFQGTVADSTVSWTGSYPSASGTVTIDSVDAHLSANRTVLTGSFTWTYAGNTNCAGTTSFDLVRQ